ncbi:MAG: hypothetical protein D8B59_05195 [Bacteroidetes bacterium]|nr:MAG: hypothetical protein D8B59_05195 [Bacteroidota bacterium]
MKRNIVIILITALSALSYAQPPSDIRTQMDVEKNIFFTQHIGLTQEQAPEFWNLYNAYQKEEAELRQQEEELIEKGIADNLSEAQYAHIRASIAFNEKRRRESKDNFFKQLDKILTPKQMILFCKTTKEYRGMLLQRLKPTNSRHKK